MFTRFASEKLFGRLHVALGIARVISQLKSHLAQSFDLREKV